MLLNCLKKLRKQVDPDDRRVLKELYQSHVAEGKSEDEASLAAVTEFHKGLFDQTNELRAAVKLPPAEYKPYNPKEIHAQFDQKLAEGKRANLARVKPAEPPTQIKPPEVPVKPAEVPPIQTPEAASATAATAPIPEIAKEPWQMTSNEAISAARRELDARDAVEGWVLRERGTGKVVMETRDPKKVAALNTERYEAVPTANYQSAMNKAIAKGNVGSNFPVDPVRRSAEWLSDWEGNVQQRHRAIIEGALADSKPVPPEVLADYPDLKSRTEATAPPPETGPVTIRGYHGGRSAGLTELTPNEARQWGKGVYFATDPTHPRTEFAAEGGHIYEADITLNNPYRAGHGLPPGIEDTEAWKDKWSKKYDDISDAWSESGAFAGEALRELGYDGVIADHPDYGQEVVSFNTQSVKKSPTGAGVEAPIPPKGVKTADSLSGQEAGAAVGAAPASEPATTFRKYVESQGHIWGDVSRPKTSEQRKLLDRLRGEFEAQKPNNQAGKIDVDLLTLGVRHFAKDVGGKAGSTVRGVRDVADAIQGLLAPAVRTEQSRTAASIVRANASEMARAHDIAEKSLEGAQAHFAKQPEQANYDFIDRMEKGQAQPDPKTQAFADTLRTMMDERRDQIRNLGTGKLENFITDYFPHIWKDAKKASNVFAQAMGKRPLEGSKAFLRQRKLPLTSDGLKLGLEPVSNNPVDLTILKLREMDKYLMAHQVMREWGQNGLLEYVKSSQKLPDGHAWIDDKVATVYGGPSSRPEGGQLIRGRFSAPEPVAKILNNYLSPGIEGTAFRAPYRAWRAASNLLNQAQLGLSFFHGGFTTLDAMISRTAVGLEDIFRYGKPIKGVKTLTSTAVSPITNLIQGSRMLKEWYSPGSQGGDIAKFVDAMVNAGGRAKMDRFYMNDAVKRFKDTFRQGNMIGAAIRLPGAAIEKIASPMMEWVVPRQKAGVFAEMAKREIERLGPNASRDDVRGAMAKVWDSVDNRMGQMVYDNLFWNKIIKDLAMASVRSVGWNVGTAREVGGGLTDYATLPYRAVQKARGRHTDPLFTHKMAYATALPMVVGTMGALTQYLFTGKGPEELKDYFFPKTGALDENGNPERISFPSYMKDIYHIKEEPKKVVTSKLHPLISTLSEMLSNEDYYSTKIRNEDDPIVQQAKDLALHLGKSVVPFSIRGVLKERERGGSLSKQLLPMVGLTPAPAYVNMSDAEKFMAAKAAEHPAGTRTKAEAERSHLRHQLQAKARQGQDVRPEISKAIQESKLKPNDMRDILRDAKELPLQLKFKRLGLPDALDAYDKMTSEDKSKVKPILTRKRPSVATLPVDQQAKIRQRLINALK